MLLMSLFPPQVTEEHTVLHKIKIHMQLQIFVGKQINKYPQ